MNRELSAKTLAQGHSIRISQLEVFPSILAHRQLIGTFNISKFTSQQVTYTVFRGRCRLKDKVVEVYSTGQNPVKLNGAIE
jgi:hypothetical protein